MKTEINLLSPQAKNDRQHTIFAHRIRAIMDAIFVCAVIVVVSYAAAYGALRTMGNSAHQNGLTEERERAEINQKIQDINAMIAIVDDRITQEYLWTPLIPDIVRLASPGITIVKIELTENPQTLILTGRASRGSVVVQYQRSLEKLPWVDHVVAPLQNFALVPDAVAIFTIFPKAKGDPAV